MIGMQQKQSFGAIALFYLDRGSEFIGQDFHDMCVNDYGIKRKVISTKSAGKCDRGARSSIVGKLN